MLSANPLFRIDAETALKCFNKFSKRSSDVILKPSALSLSKLENIRPYKINVKTPCISNNKARPPLRISTTTKNSLYKGETPKFFASSAKMKHSQNLLALKCLSKIKPSDNAGHCVNLYDKKVKKLVGDTRKRSLF